MKLVRRLLCLAGHRWRADEWVAAADGGKLVLRLRCKRCGDVVGVQQHFAATRRMSANPGGGCDGGG